MNSRQGQLDDLIFANEERSCESEIVCLERCHLAIQEFRDSAFQRHETGRRNIDVLHGFPASKGDLSRIWRSEITECGMMKSNDLQSLNVAEQAKHCGVNYSRTDGQGI
jgi:hypothetical protein